MHVFCKQVHSMKALRLSPFFLLYLAINLLFVYKYGIRQHVIEVFYLLPLYIFLVSMPLLMLDKTKVPISRTFFLTTAALFFTLTLVINLTVEGRHLHVDRWSAMEVSVSALLHGEYPYTAPDHLDGRSSNLPSLILLGLPFYLLGDVGFLQSFRFLFFVLVLLKTVETGKARLLGLLLLIGSAAYLWEVFVKSDLMSNFIFLLGFTALWHKKYNGLSFNRPLLLGGLSGFLFYTRVVALIPLTLFLFHDFLYASLRKKVFFIAASSATVALLTWLVLKDCPSLDVLKAYNPLALQNRQLPFVVSLITVVLPFFFSHKVRSLLTLMRYSVLFLGIPVTTAFLLSLTKNGFHSIIHESAFDLSYFNIITPFLIYYLTLSYDQLGRVPRTPLTAAQDTATPSPKALF